MSDMTPEQLAEALERAANVRTFGELRVSVLRQAAQMLREIDQDCEDLHLVIRNCEIEIERLRAAAWVYRTYGLPPADVSGAQQWRLADKVPLGQPNLEALGDE